MRRGSSVRARLVVLVLSVLVPTAVVVAAGAAWAWHAGRRETERELVAQARVVAEAVSRELEVAKATLLALATSPALAAGDLEAFHAQLSRAPKPEGARVSLSDASGQMRLNSLFAPGAALPKRGETGVVERVFATGLPQVSDLYVGPTTREFLVAVDVPVVDVPVQAGGRVAHDLSMAFAPAVFARVLERAVPAGGFAFATVLDGGGTIVARSAGMDAYIGRPAAPASLAAIARGEGLFDTTSQEGHPVLAANARVPGTGWTAVVATRRDLIEAALLRSLAAAGAAGAAVLLLGLLVAAHHARRIARPLGALALAAEAVGRGEEPPPAPPGVREASRVGAALARAAAELRARGRERERAEAALRESEARFRLMADTVPQIVWITDAEGRVEFFNRHWSDYTGVPYEPTTAAEVAAGFVHPDDAAATVGRFDAARRTGGTFSVEHRIRSKGGTWRWFLARAEPYRDPGTGEIVRWFGASVDVHDRKRAEARLHELNRTLETEVAARTAERDRMWETSPDLMLVIGFDGVFRRVNPAWTAVLGYAPEELVGHHVNEFVLPDHHRETVDAYEAAAAGGLPRTENRYRHKDGSIRWISWVAAPAGDATYATGRDVTAEKERQTELERAQEQLRQAQKMEAVGQLTGGIAHDFNNMLQGIGGALELARRRVEQGRVPDAFALMDAARQGVERAAALTHRLLAFARRQALDPKPVVPDGLVRGMEELVRRTVGPGIAVELRLGDGAWPVLCDANQLENALLNLAINARDAMPGGGTLTLSTRDVRLSAADVAGRDGAAPGDHVEVAVSDTGTGMAPEVAARAFEPFFTTKPIGQGTGLGLSQIYGFVRQSGGFVDLDSAPGRGTTVRLYLPRHAGDGAVPQDAAPERTEARAGAAGTVLLVEDEGSAGPACSAACQASPALR